MEFFLHERRFFVVKMTLLDGASRYADDSADIDNDSSVVKYKISFKSILFTDSMS